MTTLGLALGEGQPMTGRALMPDDAPTVRLALSGQASRDKRYALGDDAAIESAAPVVRLAMATEGRKGKTITEAFAPTVRLAHVDGAQGTNTLVGRKGVPQIEPELAPALLVSFYYLDPWEKHRSEYCYRDWALDSGAFSAKNSGKEIDLNAYIDTAARLLETDKTLTEVFALDVIGDAEASLRNAEIMWAAGIPAIPCYHISEPESYLMEIAGRCDKIALGGVSDLRGPAKTRWAQQCFARVWPKRIHGFAVGSESSIMAVPWHSVDAANWELGPCAFGSWKQYGDMSIRGSRQNLRGEVKWWLDLESRAQYRWRKQMKELL